MKAAVDFRMPAPTVQLKALRRCRMSEMAEPDQLKQLSPGEKRALLTKLLRQKTDQRLVFPMSHGQRGFWMLSQLDESDALCNVHFPARIRSPVDVDALRRAFQHLVDRHPSLRTTFEQSDGELRQRVHKEMTVPFEVVESSALSESELHQRLEDEVHRPFDLEAGPPFRAQLFACSATDYVIVVTAHHIVVDFWSVIVLLKEMRELYPAECHGWPLLPPPPRSDFAEFVSWQTEMLASVGGARLRDYWLEHLRGVSHVIDLPIDRPRPAVFTHRARCTPCQIDVETTGRLTDLVADCHTTVYTGLLAALQVLLWRHTGQSDFVIGSPFSGRTRPGFEETVGCFINMLPLRARLDGDPTFRELLAEVSETALNGLAHQDYPFSRIVDDLDVKRDAARPVLAQVSFTLEKSQWQEEAGRGRFLFPDTEAQMDVGGLLEEPYFIEHRACQTELEWALEQSEDGIHGVLQYCSDLFDDASMQRMTQHYATLLASAVANPDRRISELDWITEAERERVICEFNATDAEFSSDACLHHLFERQARERPNAIAISIGERSVRYAELESSANRLAHRLRAIGVGPDKLVALCFERGTAMYVAMLAALKAGGAFVPLDPNSPAGRLQLILADTAAVVLLAGEGVSLPATTCQVIRLQEQNAEPTEGINDLAPPDSSVMASDLAYVVMTSGSTGQPKGVMVEHRSICNTIQWRQRDLPIHANDRVLQLLPYYFDAWLSITWPVFAAGAELVLPEPGEELNPVVLLDRLIAKKVSVLPILPRLFNVLLSQSRIRDLQTVRLAFTGGEAMAPDFPSRLRDVLGLQVNNLYGPTETAVEATYWTCDPDDVNVSHRIGQPIANARAYVLDPDGKPLPVGVLGELYVGGAGIARGYLNDPDLTAERFLPDPFSEKLGARMFRTRDACRWIDGGSLEFSGRLDDQVKLRGYRIELGEIESALTSHENVLEAAVAVRETSSGESHLVAYFVAYDEAATIAAEQLQRDLKRKLPAYMIPTFFEQLSALPRTRTGKLDRRVLPACSFELTRSRSEYVAPETPLEEFLAEVWSEMLEVNRIGVEDSFYDLGGSSIQGAMLASRLQKKLGHKIRLAALFEMTTITELSRFLAESYPDTVADHFGSQSLPESLRSAAARQRRAAQQTAGELNPADLVVPLQPSGNRTPLFMVHPPGGIVVCYQQLARRLGQDQPTYGIRARGLHGEEMPSRLEDMAAEYVAAIRTVQPSGPYYLGGWSLGGVVAYDMAQQFVAVGEHVRVLALLDTTIPSGEANQQYSEDESSGIEYGLDLSMEELAALDPDEQLPYLWNHAQKLGVIDEDSSPEVVAQILDDLKRIFHTHIQLATDYALQPYSGRITLFRPEDAPVQVATARDRGWGQLSTDVDVHFVPGLHHTMVKEPHVNLLGQCLSDVIRNI